MPGRRASLCPMGLVWTDCYDARFRICPQNGGSIAKHSRLWCWCRQMCAPRSMWGFVLHFEWAPNWSVTGQRAFSFSLSFSPCAARQVVLCNDMCINFSWTIRFSVRQDGFITVRLRCKQIPFSQRPLFAFLTSQRCKVQRSTNAVQKTNLHRWFSHYVTVVGVDSLKLL